MQNKLAARVQPLLPPGSQVRHTIVCQTGPNPWFFLLTYLVYFWIQYRIVAVTDDAIYVVRASKVTVRPQEVIATLPRQTRLGPVSGLWAKIELLGERLWVNKRFQKEIEAADAAARQFIPPAAPAS
jgi:hypothetical protein